MLLVDMGFAESSRHLGNLDRWRKQGFPGYGACCCVGKLLFGGDQAVYSGAVWCCGFFLTNTSVSLECSQKARQ